MEEEEIDLVDYIKVIIKRKWVIIGVTLGATIVAGVLSYLLPPTYKISAVLEIGKIGDFVPESPVCLQEKINEGSYNGILKEKIKESIPKIEASTFEKTNLLVIKTNTKNLEIGEEVLKELSNIIINEHKEILEEQRKFLEEEIKKEEIKIAILEKSKNLPELQYLYVEHLSRIDSLKNDLATATSTSLIKLPSGSSSQNLLINIVISAILGVFIGTLVAFFQEFLEKNKERLRE